jgi:hypothetical protein
MLREATATISCRIPLMQYMELKKKIKPMKICDWIKKQLDLSNPESVIKADSINDGGCEHFGKYCKRMMALGVEPKYIIEGWDLLQKNKQKENND